MRPHIIKIAALSAIISASIAAAAFYFLSARDNSAPNQIPPQASPVTGALNTQATNELQAIKLAAQEVLANYRKIIVLLADDAALAAKEQQEARRVGQALFHDNQDKRKQLDQLLLATLESKDSKRYETLASLLDYIEQDADLFDADRLAFRETLHGLQEAIVKDSSLTAIKLHKRISEDLDAIGQIERNYEKEITQIFGRFEQRGIELKRERWGDYLAKLQKRYSRAQILKDFGVILPYPAQPSDAVSTRVQGEEIIGTELPKKTVVLTFDDGPHKVYSDEIAAILKQYDVPGVFFSVGSNIGSVDAGGHAKLGTGATVSRRLVAAGHVLANHSFSHKQLARVNDETVKTEILHADLLLKTLDKNRAPLFRFPYGAKSSAGMETLSQANLKSVMWNIDSLDWADPVPSSIADRVLRSIDKEGRGIILFHDIHARSVKALPLILERLVADGYSFATWDGTGFKTVKGGVALAPEKVASSTGYANSWAVVIGIDEYAKWPKLQYAARDAQAVRETLIEKFGFATERVISLNNAQATRQGILAAFHDKLAHGGVQKNDRIFVFFAGHGATVKLSSGRDLGYIIPSDADPKQISTDAIAMTEIQNIAESLEAKHLFFVMDACYSGLGLTRGATNTSFLRENGKRIGRQMLTAGGADQLVADGGPNGHSIFTWTLLQGLAGKGDLNGDGLITATELAAYVAPAVASVSPQTPAFGSLPGSQGGDFIFTLPAETEFLSPQTAQLSNDAIALNNKLAAVQPIQPPQSSAMPSVANDNAATPIAKPQAVVVKNLAGGEHKIQPPVAVPSSNRQLAQRANDRGLQYFKEKQYAKAEAEFTEALKLRPDFALAANNLGFAFYKQDKYKEAARWYENTIKIDSSRAIAYFNLADAYLKADEREKAKKAFATYIELAPNASNVQYAKEQLAKL